MKIVTTYSIQLSDNEAAYERLEAFLSKEVLNVKACFHSVPEQDILVLTVITEKIDQILVSTIQNTLGESGKATMLSTLKI